MFSTSVLECRKSLDREAPRRGLFAWDKENRPSDANKEPKVRELCEEPRRVQLEEEKQDLQRQLRDAHQGRKAAEAAFFRPRAPPVSGLWRRRVSQAKAQKLQLVLRGSVASEQLAGLHQLQQQMRQISGHMTLQEEQLQCLTNRRLASWAVHRAVVRGLLKQPPSAEAPQDAQKAPSEEESWPGCAPSLRRPRRRRRCGRNAPGRCRGSCCGTARPGSGAPRRWSVWTEARAAGAAGRCWRRRERWAPPWLRCRSNAKLWKWRIRASRAKWRRCRRTLRTCRPPTRSWPGTPTTGRRSGTPSSSRRTETPCARRTIA
ncbi:unnamed protein product [Effrenium voratum]|nr:unnamed protein product [Effrenium voratum]